MGKHSCDLADVYRALDYPKIRMALTWLLRHNHFAVCGGGAVRGRTKSAPSADDVRDGLDSILGERRSQKWGSPHRAHLVSRRSGLAARPGRGPAPAAARKPLYSCVPSDTVS